MKAIRFCKFHGFGNDYIVVERENIRPELTGSDLAKAICDRHTGAGADGIAVLDRTSDPDSDHSCQIVNPDGSIAGFSGNGTRCAAAYLYYKGLWSKADLRLKTLSGVKHFHLLESPGPGSYLFEAEIGKPEFGSERIPVATAGRGEVAINETIILDGREHKFSAVNVGNPVACIFVDDFPEDWRGVGRRMETHEMFPERCNIVFAKVVDRENIDIRIWERGAGETAASGTCSAGAAVLAAFQQKTARQVSVRSPGGTTSVLWRDDDEIILTGRADLAFCGEWAK